MIYTTIPKNAYQGLLPATATTLYTTPTSMMGPAYKTILSEILLCNTDSVARTYTLYIIPSGGTAGNSNTIRKTESLAAAGSHGHAVTLRFGTVLEQGTFIQMLASSANTICATITVAELLQQGM